jgi:hypothetical protein
MNRILHTIQTLTFVEAAEAASMPCRRLPVNDGSRLGPAVSLAPRCLR